MNQGPNGHWNEELVVSPAFNPAADDAKIAADTRIRQLEEQNSRLSLTNKRLRDRVKDLVNYLADFGVYVEP